MDLEKIVLRCLIIVLAVLLLGTTQNEDIEDCECETCMMYNVNATRGILGIYYRPKYFCVWVENRTNDAIQETIAHEYCHHLVHLNKEHFCEEY